MTPAMCLALAIYFEARSEPIEGQIAIADVVMTRVDDRRYPNSVCGVVYASSAFSWTHDGLSDTPAKGDAWDLAKDVAKSALASDARSITATHYHTVDITPFWASEYDIVATIGRHVFYMNNTRYK